MNILKRTALAAAATTMAALPVAASAAPVPASRPAATRAATPVTHENAIAAGTTATFVSIGILAALVVIVLVATNDSGNDSPNSP